MSINLVGGRLMRGRYLAKVKKKNNQQRTTIIYFECAIFGYACVHDGTYGVLQCVNA